MFKSMEEHVDASRAAFELLDKIMDHDQAVFVYEAIDHATRCKDYQTEYGNYGQAVLTKLQQHWLSVVKGEI